MIALAPMVVDGLIPTSIAVMGNTKLGWDRAQMELCRIIGALNPMRIGLHFASPTTICCGKATDRPNRPEL